MKNHRDNMKAIISILFVCISGMIYAQNPAPADTATKRILLLGGYAHLGNGKVIPQSAIGIANGKITFVMDGRNFKPSRLAFDTIIDVYGKQIYPGIIAMNTSLGINEIEAVRATNDYNETGSLNASARSIIAYNTDSKVTPTVRSNGIMLAQVTPRGGLISGQSSVVELDGWNYEDAAYKMDEGIWMNFPSLQTVKAWWADAEDEQKKRSEKQMSDLNELFYEAQSYAAGNNSVYNPNFEAMKGLFNKSKTLYMRCNYVKDILAAISFGDKFKLKIVLVGARDGWRVTKEIKENNIPVVIMRTHVLPERDDDDIDLPYKLPYLLSKEGIDVAITDDGFWQDRNIPFQAGEAVGYGMDKEDALKAITLTPARILGIDATVGSLETGKDATIIVSSGDVLDMKSSDIQIAYIRGKEINLDNIQKQLYRKYERKYGLKESE
jgi:imidazolonepropionase-like amidohydrolase